MSEFQLFPTTHWSLVQRAGEDPSDAQRDALGDLLKQYLGAFRTYVMSKYQVSAHKAEDLVSGFIASRVVEKNLIGKADAGRGKFRNFLMTALERYVIDQLREDSAVKRGGDSSRQDVADLRDRIPGRSAGDDPAAAFDAGWARDIIRQAIERMREATEKSRPELWCIFSDRVLGPAYDNTAPTAYQAMIKRLGFADEGQAANALHTAKRIFARILRGVVAEYAMTAEEVDEEIASLKLTVGK
jgi:RNA polymerase sigma-70 factor (ECF subfamily)